jgi:hypothetical protein
MTTSVSYHTPHENSSLHNADLRKQAAALVSVLHRGGAWGMFWTPNGNGGAKKLSHYVPTAKSFTPPAAWLRSANLYFGVHPLTVTRKPWQASRNGDVAAINALFAEFDAVDFLTDDEIDEFMPLDPEGGEEERDKARDDAYRAEPDAYKARALAHVQGLPVRPSAAWDSGGGYQCVWLLAETILIDDDNRADIADLQARWVAFVGADAGAADLRRVLRWPGGRNRKPRYAPAYPLVAFTWCDIGKRYDVDELRGMLPPETAPHTARRTAGPPDDAAVAASVALVDAVLAHGDMMHGGWQEWDGSGRRAILDVCPFQPENDPHGRDGAAGVFIRADGTIGATCHHNRCKNEIHDHGDNGWQWLREIAGMPKRDAAADLVALHENIVRTRHWCMTSAAADELRDAGIRPETGIKLITAAAELMAEWNRAEITPGFEQWALRAGVGVATAKRTAPKLHAAGLLIVTPPADDAPRFTPTAIALNPDRQSDTSSFQSMGTTGITLTIYSDHRCDDAFKNNHAAYKRRHPDALAPLGDHARLFSHIAAHPDRTAAELSEATSIGVRTVQRLMERWHGYGLIAYSAEAHNVRRYAVTDDWEESLDELRPSLTSYGVQGRREEAYATRRVQMARLSGDDRRTARAEDHYNRLKEAQGCTVPEPARYIGKWRGWRWRTRWDTAERDHETAELRDQVHGMKSDGLAPVEIRRMMTFAGYAAAEVSKALAYAGAYGLPAAEVRA